MDTKLFKDRMVKFEIACKQMEVVPEILFARGKQGMREVLLMLSGPTLDMKALNELRADIKVCLDAKEDQLNGKMKGPINL